MEQCLFEPADVNDLTPCADFCANFDVDERPSWCLEAFADETQCFSRCQQYYLSICIKIYDSLFLNNFKTMKKEVRTRFDCQGFHVYNLEFDENSKTLTVFFYCDTFDNSPFKSLQEFFERYGLSYLCRNETCEMLNALIMN